MKYSEFLQNVKESISDYFPKDQQLQVEIQKIYKNNRVLDGLTVRRNGETNVPLLYLDDYYYKQIVLGTPKEEVFASIAGNYQKLQSEIPQISIRDLPANVSSNLYLRVVNYERNKDWLQQIPHEKVLDLAVFPYIKVVDGSGYSVAVTNGMVKEWGISETDLLDRAKSNNINQKIHIDSIESLLQQMGVNISLDGMEEGSRLYCLTNEEKYYGASLILDQRLAERIAEELGDYYVIPSSIHEALLFPADGQVNPYELQNMIMEVNATVVSKEEFLSNSLYHFNARTKALSIAVEEPKKRKNLEVKPPIL